MSERKNSSVAIFKKIFNKNYKIKEIRSREFLDLLRSHEFKSLDELNSALNAYENVVLTKSVLFAITVTLPENPSIIHLPIQYKIREGMEMKHTVEEYNYEGPMHFPKWYIELLNKFSVPSEEQFMQPDVGE